VSVSSTRITAGWISIRGLDEVQRALAKLEPAETKKLLQKASSAGAKAVKPYAQAETPRGRTGRLRKSISATQARRDRPAAIVRFRPRIAFYRTIVIGGTKPHQIRFPDQVKAGVPKRAGNIRHPGAHPNDIMARAWAKGETETLAAIGKVIDTYLDQL
jgi:hypothetical protein